MQLIHRLQISQQFDCLFTNWKWIFSLCCSFTSGSSTVDINPSEEKSLLVVSRNDSVCNIAEKKKKWSDEVALLSPSIPPTEEDEKPNWRNIEDLDSEKGMDFEDMGTVAAEDFEKSGEASKKDDDNRSDYSDERIDKFGTVVVNFKFEMMKNTLYIDVVKVDHLPSKIVGGPSAYQIFIKIFDDSNRSLKKWHSPMFRATKFPPDQTVEYSDLSAKDISSTAVRIRLYGCERKRRDKLLSESIIGMASVNFRKHDSYRLRLEKRADIKLISNTEIEMDEDNYFTSEASKKVVVKVEKEVGNQSELLLGLGYNAVTGRVTVEIVKGNSFKNPLSRDEEKLPNPLVKITLCAKNNQVISQSKTTVRQNQANPLFKEKFMFQVPKFQLEELSIIIGVYHKKSAHRKELIGWFSVGLHNTSEEEQSHWKSMMEANGDVSFQWHLLQENTQSRHGLPGAN